MHAVSTRLVSHDVTHLFDGEKLLVKGENTKNPEDWKNFLTNDENKQQLVKITCKSWESYEYANKQDGDGETTEKALIEDLKSTQEETDTTVIIYALYGKNRVTTLFKFEPLTVTYSS
ncbi:hypothetical protein DPMN_153290 [Dreissena polymorpha]|uniref:Uncharacterized protein n=1 Tax=Dreissena polymorpha TaxID=45954 RepID=A0A9D4FM19_DREPO|nr:hypothetical protein DPMN_153290 [Dreissena polymorpha]